MSSVLADLHSRSLDEGREIEAFREESCLDPALENPANKTRWALRFSVRGPAGRAPSILEAVAGQVPSVHTTSTLSPGNVLVASSTGLSAYVSTLESGYSIRIVGNCTSNPEGHVMLKNRLDQGPDGSAPVRFSDES